MDKSRISEGISKLSSRFHKMKYPLLILLLGTFLMLLPGKQNAEETQEPAASAESVDPVSDCEARLEEILSEIQGAGKVSVMLTVKSGERTIYQQDTDLDTDQSGSGESRRAQNSTVLISHGSGNEEAVVTQVVGPEYRGAVVVCGGADNARVKLAIVQAVSSVTGLGADQITVLKMK